MYCTTDVTKPPVHTFEMSEVLLLLCGGRDRHKDRTVSGDWAATQRLEKRCLSLSNTQKDKTGGSQAWRSGDPAQGAGLLVWLIKR